MLHLVRRFFGFLTAAPLTPHEQRIVADALRPEVAALFFAQRSEDQRHAYGVADGFRGEPDLLEAALTHDVGKATSDLGAVGRSFATLGGTTGLPIPARWRAYLAHGGIGADALERAGAGPLAVSFARHHPGPVPASVDPGAWRRLSEADAT